MPTLRLTPFLERRRMTAVRRFILPPLLDLGCGPALAAKCVTTHETYVGVDREAAKLLEARSRFPTRRFMQADLEKDRLDLPDASFRTILMMAVVEHLADPTNVLLESRRLLREDGFLVMTTPTPFGKRIHDVLAHLGLVSKEAVANHVRIYSRTELTALVESFGFVVTHSRPFELGANQVLVAALS